MENTTQQPKSKQSGFTLIELSISIIIIGILLVGAIQAFKVYEAKQKLIRISSYMVDVNQALKAFPTMIDPATITGANPQGDAYGRMPCPAPLDGTAYGSTYSQEQNPPNCAGAMRSVTPDGVVFVGKFPANTLRLRNDYMKDSFDNYILYVVSASAVDPATYGLSLGSIVVREREVSPVDGTITELPQKNGVQYALVSPGENRACSIDFTGALRYPMDAVDSTQMEIENCFDFANANNPSNSWVLASVHSDANAGDFYDDYIDFDATLPVVASTSGPASCPQTHTVQVYGNSCPPGWDLLNSGGNLQYSATAVITDPYGNEFPGAASAGITPVGYYNEDPDDEGNFYLTQFPTDETVVGAGNDMSTKVLCSKQEGNTKQNRCFNDKLEVLVSTGSPDVWNGNVTESSPTDYQSIKNKCPNGYKLYGITNVNNVVESQHNGGGGNSVYHGSTYTNALCSR